MNVRISNVQRLVHLLRANAGGNVAHALQTSPAASNALLNRRMATSTVANRCSFGDMSSKRFFSSGRRGDDDDENEKELKYVAKKDHHEDEEDEEDRYEMEDSDSDSDDDDDSSDEEDDHDQDEQEEEAAQPAGSESEFMDDATAKEKRARALAEIRQRLINEWKEKYGEVVTPRIIDGEFEEAGFRGDLDEVNEEGVPTWLAAVRSLREASTDLDNIEKQARRLEAQSRMGLPRYRSVDKLGRAYGTGRRKTSIARVWIKESAEPFQGRVTVNKMDLVDYFPRKAHLEDIVDPFVAVDQIGVFDVWCTVEGGGKSGQAGAIRLGIARALQNFNPEFRAALKKPGYLTRDPRMVERKKPGQPKARKKYQWVKR